MIDYIEYNGKCWRVEWVYVEGWGSRLIGTESLGRELIPNGKYRDEEAEHIDDSIFYYVPDKEINRKDLGQYVSQEVG